jgi:hypothetical protein
MILGVPECELKTENYREFDSSDSKRKEDRLKYVPF